MSEDLEDRVRIGLGGHLSTRTVAMVGVATVVEDDSRPIEALERLPAEDAVEWAIWTAPDGRSVA